MENFLANNAGTKFYHPIDDLNERAFSKKYTDEEKLLRRKLAASFRLADLQGWSEVIYNNITCRLPDSYDHFLINPFGLFFHEVTASSLLKVDVNGTVIDPGSTNFGLNLRGYTLHSAIHMNRPDVQCVIHAHTPEAIGISALKDGYVAVSQEACFVGKVSDYGFRGILDDLAERKAIADTLGENNSKIYGAASSADLILPDQTASNKTYSGLLKGYTTGTDDRKEMHWAQGELEWEGWMRLLDSMGMKTGHNYRIPVWRNN